ncbi:hypothetical protein RJ639_029283 [Escallonia herrerae]|uniref:S-protein homolog n=1 Tax=Escallonia herrerae TaxID=1293975 RepID=A0AA88X6C1_9ASTE|nr:hypothetical protein RJ639_029283 [Escallonia herrerae]
MRTFYFFLFFFSFGLICSTWAEISDTENEVHIVNALPDRSHLLSANCSCTDIIYDPGNRTLNSGDDFHWSFSTHIIDILSYFCSFEWNSKRQFVEVFSTHPTFKWCKGKDSAPVDCYWFVRGDGFYVSNDYNKDPREWKKAFNCTLASAIKRDFGDYSLEALLLARGLTHIPPPTHVLARSRWHQLYCLADRMVLPMAHNILMETETGTLATDGAI